MHGLSWLAKNQFLKRTLLHVVRKTDRYVDIDMDEETDR